MPIITLTTDLGLKDYYVASIKGQIYSQLSDVTIIDISHEIPDYEINVAAFCLKNCYKDFPEGTIHIIGVSPEADDGTKHILVKKDGYYFIGADNGIFALLFEEQPSEIFELDIIPPSGKATFPTKEVFVKAACHIGRGGTPELIGHRIDTVTEKTNFQPAIDEDVIRGIAVYIDSYGNITTNITRHLFGLIGKNRPFTIVFRRADYNINVLHDAYNAVPQGEKVALFGANNHLEIAINKGNANKLFGIKLRDTIRIEFHNPQPKGAGSLL